MLEYKLKKRENQPATFNMAITGTRIVFMGTPDFAVPSLEALLKAGYNIVGVVTAPDKPAGRGMKLTESAVKKYATKRGLNILQPEKLRDPEFLSSLKGLHANLQVVVAFRMLPEVVWNMPPMGTINLHASLLPQYRGAAPINWAIINGERESGLTTFKLQQEIDTGNILMQEQMPIGDDETAGELHDRMKDTGAELLVKTVTGLLEDTLTEKEQLTIPTSTEQQTQSTTLKHAPKIFTETCRINWNKNAVEIHNQIRGLSPFPGAFTDLGDKTIKIFRSEKEMRIPTTRKGRWESDKRTFLKYACADGYIHVKELQLEGKKKMMVDEFLRGYRF